MSGFNLIFSFSNASLYLSRRKKGSSVHSRSISAIAWLIAIFVDFIVESCSIILYSAVP